MKDDDYIDAVQRRDRSWAVLKKQGIPVLESLPCLAPISAIRVPDFESVVCRAAALACITYRCDLDFLHDLDDFMRENNLFIALTDEEKKFYFSTPSPAFPANGFMRWRIESCRVLFWVLGHFNSLSFPDTWLDSKKLYHLFFAGGMAEFKSASILRDPGGILDAADLYFRYRAVCLRALEMGDHPPKMMSFEVVRERYVALNWLIGRGSWDELQRNN